MIARCHSRQSVFVGVSLLYGIHGITDNGVYLGVVFLHVALSQLEERPFGLLHQVVYVYRLVKGFGLDDAGKGDELSGQRLLRNDARMIFDVGRRGHLTGQFRNIAWTAHVLQVTMTGQLFGHRPYVDRVFMHRQVTDSRIYFLITWLVETLRRKYLTHNGVGILVYHQRTQHGTLHVRSLWLHMGVGIVDGHLTTRPTTALSAAIVV